MANEPHDDQRHHRLEWHGRPAVKAEPDDSYEGALRYQAISAFCAHKFADALEKFDELISLSHEPADESWRGVTLYALGRYAEACAYYESMLEREPTNARVLNYLAHIKCTCELDELRDGPRAVELATRLCEISEWKLWSHVSVLAGAYAEVGDWEQAERFASLTLQIAPSEEKDRRRNRLEQYREHRPFRCSPEQIVSLLIPNL